MVNVFFLNLDDNLEQPEAPCVAVVIVNYRTPALTMDCLHSLEKEAFQFPGLKVYVVDNASGDDSLTLLQDKIQTRQWQSKVQLIPQTRNGGFAYGNNAAIRPLLASAAPPDFFWLLNSDTVVLPGALAALIQALNCNPKVGIAGSRLENPDGSPQISAFRFPSVTSEFLSAMRFGLLDRLFASSVVSPPVQDQEHPTDWLAGASLLVRRDLFTEVGLMDEDYFLYYEEVDLCARAARAGWQCRYVPSSRVIHLVGQSSGVTSRDAAQRRLPAYWFESRSRFFRKNYGGLRFLVANCFWLLGHLAYRVRCWVQQKPLHLPEFLLSDFLKYNFRSIRS